MNAHDLACGCDHPIEHIIYTTATKGRPSNFTDAEKATLKKCLGITDDPIIKEEETGIDAGDLDRLFAEDAEEDSG